VACGSLECLASPLRRPPYSTLHYYGDGIIIVVVVVVVAVVVAVVVTVVIVAVVVVGVGVGVVVSLEAPFTITGTVQARTL
jgi:hypothetical protein